MSSFHWHPFCEIIYSTTCMKWECQRNAGFFYKSRHVLKLAIIIIFYIISHSPTHSFSYSLTRNQKIYSITPSNKIRDLNIAQDSSISKSPVHPHMHVTFLDTLDIIKNLPRYKNVCTKRNLPEKCSKNDSIKYFRLSAVNWIARLTLILRSDFGMREMWWRKTEIIAGSISVEGCYIVMKNVLITAPFISDFFVKLFYTIFLFRYINRNSV